MKRLGVPGVNGGPVPPSAVSGYVPPRCRRSPNASLDRGFALYICNQRDHRCVFHGPIYVLDDDGRHYECRLRGEQESPG